MPSKERGSYFRFGRGEISTMELIYLYVRKYGTIFQNQEFNFSSNFRASFKERKLKIEENRDSIKNYYGCLLYTSFHYLIFPALKKRYNHFERFINEVLPVTKKEYASTEELKSELFDYDVYICGGDQIWNPTCQDFETAYYLSLIHILCKKNLYSKSSQKSG